MLIIVIVVFIRKKMQQKRILQIQLTDGGRNEKE